MSNLAEVRLPSREIYIRKFRDAALRRLARSSTASRCPQDHEDIAGQMVLRVLLNFEDFSERYPNPAVLAAVMAAQATISYRRSEGAQRGEGARHTRRVTLYSSDYRVARPSAEISRISPTDAPATGRAVRRHSGELTDSHDAAQGYLEDRILEIDHARTTWAAIDEALALEGISDRDRWLLWRVDAEGTTVTQAAAELDQSRETAQRAIGRVRTRVRRVAERAIIPTSDLVSNGACS